MNIDFNERLKKGNDFIKNMGIKLGKVIVPALLISSILLNPVASHAWNDGMERPTTQTELVLKEVKMPNVSINMTSLEIQKTSLDSINSLIDKSISLDKIFDTSHMSKKDIVNQNNVDFSSKTNGEFKDINIVQTEQSIERKEIYNTLEKLESNFIELIKISVANSYINGDFNGVSNTLKNAPQTYEKILQNYVKKSLDTNNVEILKNLNELSQKELNTYSSLLKLSLNEMVNMELNGQKTGISSQHLQDMIYLLKSNYQNESFNGKKRVEINNNINQEISKLEKVKSIVDKRIVSATYQMNGQQQTISLH